MGSSSAVHGIAIVMSSKGGIIDQDEQMIKARLDFVINAIAHQYFTDAEQAKKDMEAFAAANEARLYKLFKACADPQTDLRTLVKSRVRLDSSRVPID